MSKSTTKPGFERSSVSKIRSLKRKTTSTRRNIERMVEELDQDEHLEITTQIIPGMYFQRTITEDEASLAWQKYGSYAPLGQPRTEEEAMRWKGGSLALIRNAIAKMKSTYKRAEENPSLGLEWFGISDDDKRKRVFQWNSIIEARTLLQYCDSIGRDIVDKIYTGRDSDRIGAQVHARVPSRRFGYPDYKVVLTHVPIDGGTDKRAIIWNLDIKNSGSMPANAQHLIRRRAGTENTIDFFEQSIVAYFDTMRKEADRGNFTPLEMNPFPLLNEDYDSFGKKLNDNVVVYDFARKKLRHLYEAEKSWILMQRIQRLGPEKIN